MQKIVKCLKDELKDIQQPRILTPLSLLNKMQQQYFIDQRPLKHVRDRLTQLINSLHIDKVEEYSSLNLIADFSVFISTYFEGFSLILEPYPEENQGLAGQFDPLI